MGTEAPATPPDELIPLSGDTATHAQTLNDERYRTSYYGEGGTAHHLARNLSNILNVQYDLKDRERCTFVTMLKALMLRQIMMEDNRTDFKATADDWKNVDLKFGSYLDEAVEFVNAADGHSLKEGLQKYCNTSSEIGRYPLFVDVLNEILLHFRKESRDNEIKDEDIIFAINDPVVIESTHLPKSTKRKPDLICLLAKKYRSLQEDCEDYDFLDCVCAVTKSKTKNNNSEYKATWGDILHSWELKSTGAIKLQIREDFEAKEILDREEQETLTSSGDIYDSFAASASQVRPSTNSGVKRKRRSENHVTSSKKKLKVDEPLSPLMTRAPKDVQCAFYGIERLRHSMDITHSMSVLLDDAELTLFWYDSQGCIQANTINIVAELPLLVVMIKIFHGFPLGMWGDTPIDIWGKDEVPYCRNESPVGQFQIIGRRTFTADAAKCPTIHKPAAQRLSEDVLFLKSAWPEVKRRKEPEIIHEAYERAKNMLDTEARSVTDHLPVIASSCELAYTSTQIIRHLVKSKKEDGFRVQLWMLSKKLQPIHALKPNEFWLAFWQTLRCHALLWRIGIAHGDVSLSNLMYKEDNKYGVLNDFDLSTIMEPNAGNPDRQGLERTGTLPFMAVELLNEKGFNGKIPRRYDHELESFAWVLVWVSRCVLNGEEYEPPPALKEWLASSNRQVYLSKTSFYVDHEDTPTTSDYGNLEMVTNHWIRVWNNYSQKRKGRRFEAPLETSYIEPTSSEYLQALIEACTKCAKADPIASVPIDVAWVDGLSELKFISPASIENEEHPLQRNSDRSSLSRSDGSDLNNSDDSDMYADDGDDPVSIPIDSEFYETDGGRGSGRDSGDNELNSEGDGG